MPGVAEKLENDFLDYDDNKWFYYKNAIEDKKALNDWNQFPATTYSVFCELMSNDVVDMMADLIGGNIYVDHGLHGGGWHIHASGGNLNPHLDYSIHPKMGLQRKLNIIMYVSSKLRPEHGGQLGLWSHSDSDNTPDQLIKEIDPKFNRAVLFDTTQNSWHGMSRKLTQPIDIFRKSLAIYYLTDPPHGVDVRERALFAPRENQKNDTEIANLIKTRSDSKLFHTAYKK
jgi:Rps23 Pro-64 3,4-dihydroxylase Tpa1-like proline 4-hydroxylase